MLISRVGLVTKIWISRQRSSGRTQLSGPCGHSPVPVLREGEPSETSAHTQDRSRSFALDCPPDRSAGSAWWQRVFLAAFACQANLSNTGSMEADFHSATHPPAADVDVGAIAAGCVSVCRFRTFRLSSILRHYANSKGRISTRIQVEVPCRRRGHGVRKATSRFTRRRLGLIDFPALVAGGGRWVVSISRDGRQWQSCWNGGIRRARWRGFWA